MEIIKSIFIVLAAIIFTLFGSRFYAYIPEYQREQADKDTEEREKKNREKEEVIYKKPKRYIILSVIGSLLISLMYIFLYKQNLFISNLKTLTVLAILWPIAYYDYKFLKIPNHIIKYAFIIRAIEAVAEILLYRQAFLTVLLDVLITTIVLFVICFICNFISKGAIGMGDVKMLIVIGLFLGSSRTFAALMVSLIVAFFAALFLLVSGRKGKKDIIPFAPAVLAGIFLAAFAMGV